VERARLPWLELESDSELAINLDGESVTGTRFRFEAMPRALRVHLPPSCPLLTGNAA
jgi:diacylglycerol kinase family enzyme